MSLFRPHIPVAVAALFLTTMMSLGTLAAADPTTPVPAPLLQRIEGGPIVVEQELDRSSMLAAERLTVTWRVRSPVDVHVTLPPIPAPGSKAGDFSVVLGLDDPPRLEGTPSRLVLVRRLVLEPFLPGRYASPTIEAAWSRGDSERGLASTTPATIEVRSLLPTPASSTGSTGSTASSADPLDPGSIRDEHPVGIGGGGYARPAIVGVVALALAIILAWVVARRRRPVVADPVDVAFALANAVRFTQGDRKASRQSLDDLAASLKAALSDRVSARAAAMAGGEATPVDTEVGTERRLLLEEATPLLARLDHARYSGEDPELTTLESLRQEVVTVVARLHAMPRGGGKGAA